MKRFDPVSILIVLAAIWLLLCSGCVSGNGPNVTAPTGSAIARAVGYNESADRIAERQAKHSGGPQREGFHLIRAILGDQYDALTEAAAANEKAAEAFNKQGRALEDKSRDYDVLYSGWGARLQRFVHRLLVWLCVYLVAAVGLRIAAMFVSGPIGAGMALVSTAMFGPLAWVQSGFDNLWFRRVAPAAKKRRRR